MCGRYFYSADPDAVADAFGTERPDPFPPRYNIAPSQPIGIVRQERGARSFGLVRWGFIPTWAKGETLQRYLGKPLINARSETAAEKPTFRAAFKRRRCLVPASGFYEWRTEKGAKQPYAVRTAAGGPLGFAGLWETALDPDGGEVDTAAILTTAAGPDLADLHHREPVVIRPKDYDWWLGADETMSAALGDLLTAAPVGFWRADPVSTAVNNARHEGEALARPVGQGELS